MAFPKKPREYFLHRIKEFFLKNGRAPRSNEINSNFHTNVKKYFGSWSAAVKMATGVQLSHAAQSNDELLKPIREYYNNSLRIMPLDKIPDKTLLQKRFGNYNNILKAAILIDVELSVLRAVDRLSSNSAFCASAAEIRSELLKEKLNMDNYQIRANLIRAEKNGLVSIRHGDRIALYFLTAAGKKTVTEVADLGNKRR